MAKLAGKRLWHSASSYPVGHPFRSPRHHQHLPHLPSGLPKNGSTRSVLSVSKVVLVVLIQHIGEHLLQQASVGASESHKLTSPGNAPQI